MLLKLCVLGCGISLINEIFNCLTHLFAWGDSLKILSALDFLKTSFENSKTPSSSRISSALLYGKIFNGFWAKTMSPPTKDAFEGLLKMYKSSSEWY